MSPGAINAGLQRPLPERPDRRRAWRPPGFDDANYLNMRLLRLVVLARLFVVCAGLVLAVMAARAGMPTPLPAIAAIVLVVVTLSWVGLERARRHGVTQDELLLQILCDVGLLTLAFAVAGHYESAFDYLYILPLVFAASAFSAWRIAVVGLLVATGWGFIELIGHAGSADAVAFEVASHVLVGSVMVYFAHAVARLSRLHERVICGERERAISALGAKAKGLLATRAAHTLSTPLGTMAVVVADLRQGRIPPAERDTALETIASQIAICKLQLSGLLVSAGVERGEGGYRANALQLLTEMREECLIYYPSGVVSIESPGESAAGPEVVIELSLFNAIAGMVKDLAREPPHVAHLKAWWDSRHVVIEVGAPPGGEEVPPLTGRRRERAAVLAAIVGRHGGRLDLAGDGRRFTVRLPQVT